MHHELYMHVWDGKFDLQEVINFIGKTSINISVGYRTSQQSHSFYRGGGDGASDKRNYFRQRKKKSHCVYYFC